MLPEGTSNTIRVTVADGTFIHEMIVHRMDDDILQDIFDIKCEIEADFDCFIFLANKYHVFSYFPLHITIH
jgi:hypothetical protein